VRIVKIFSWNFVSAKDIQIPKYNSPGEVQLKVGRAPFLGTVSPSFSLIVNLTFLIFTAITALTLMSDITADHLDIIAITITADHCHISPIAILGNPD